MRIIQPNHIQVINENKWWLFFFALLLATSALLTEILLYSQNTLFLNNHWIINKRTLEMGLMGADEFLIERNSLSKNALDLGKWYGHQEVLLKAPNNIKVVELKFQIPDDSYIDFIFAYNNSTFSGIRISRHKGFDSIAFSSNHEGKFDHTEKIVLQPLSSNWHYANIQEIPKGIHLQINEKHFDLINQKKLHDGLIGFRSGLNGGKLDNIRIKTANGIIFEDSFRNSNNWVKFFTIHLVLIAFLTAIIYRIFAAQQTLKLASAILIQIIFILTLWFVIDFYYWSEIPFQNKMKKINDRTPIQQLGIEDFRYKFFEKWHSILGGKLITNESLGLLNYTQERILQGPIFCQNSKLPCGPISKSELQNKLENKKNAFRILFIGTSQTIGAGASTIERTFFAKIHQALNKEHPNKNIESLNIAESGSNCENQFSEFKKNYHNYTFNVIALNLSNNDNNLNQFTQCVHEFKKIATKNKAKLILIEEANNFESKNAQAILEKHKVLRKISKEEGIITIPLHDHLNLHEISSSGLLWWDYVHLTDHGHTAAAMYLTPFFLTSYKAEKKN